MFDWQLLIVSLIVAGSGLLVGVRTWNHIRSFTGGVQKSQCMSGCAGCGVQVSRQACERKTALIEPER